MRKKILVIDDDPLLRQIYHDALVASYDVDVAVDGEDGYEKLKTLSWDLALIDMVMPKMSGVQVVTKLRKEIRESDLKNKIILFLTNMNDDQDIKSGLKVGNGYLIKSQITPGDLINEVKTYLDK